MSNCAGTAIFVAIFVGSFIGITIYNGQQQYNRSFETIEKQFSIAKQKCKDSGGVKSFNLNNNYTCDNGMEVNLSNVSNVGENDE